MSAIHASRPDRFERPKVQGRIVGANRTALLMVAAMSLGAVSRAHADPPRAYLSWNAPYGQPRATQTLSAPCDSTGRRDTLFVSFVTGRAEPTLYAAVATLYFRAPVGDKLGRAWWFGGGPTNPWNVRIEFPKPESADSSESWASLGCVNPWKARGPNPPSFDRTASSGRLTFSYAVDPDSAAAVRDSTTYGFARVIVPRPRADVELCEQPVCIELATLDLYFDPSTVTAADLPGRSVTWNSPGGAVCAPANGASESRAAPGTGNTKRKR